MANDFGGDGKGLLDKEVNKRLKSPNTHEKEDEYVAKMVMPITTFKFLMGVFSALCGAAFYFFHMKNLFSLGEKIPIWAYCIIPGIFILSLVLIHPVMIDVWVPHVASSRIGSSYCRIGMRTITVDYDVLNSKKDINKFIEEITDKSEDWNYFIKKISSTTMTIKISVRPKVKIPTKASFEGEYADNEMWNYIPLGICLTDNSILGSVNWMLNDNNKVKGEHKETIPSTSFLVAGGTGSGKSVLENNIIRHVNKFNENFQAMLVDVKRVEFGGLSNLEAIKAVALDIKEAEACLRASREIMYSRFQFMEKAGVNNVYKLLDYKCSYFYIENVYSEVRKLYQFDEILYCEVDGTVEITTIDKIAQKAENSDVYVYLSGQKEEALKLSTDRKVCQDDKTGKTLYIREITPGDFYAFNKRIFYKKDIIPTDNGDMEAEKVFDMVSSGKKVSSKYGTLDKDSFKCIECIFKPKAILTVVDEMSEVMGTNDFKAQASISDSISSIARLGRAAACHLCLATQRPSGNVISSDLKNNIQMTTLLGGFGTSESTLCFDEDISDFCKPEIKGRGFVKTGNEIYEYQSFWIGDPKYIIKDKDFVGKEPIDKRDKKSASEDSYSFEQEDQPASDNRSDSDSSSNFESAPIHEESFTPEEPISNKSEMVEEPTKKENSEKGPRERTSEEKEAARQKRQAARKAALERRQKKKDEELEELIERENSDPNYKEKKPRKPSWDAEDFFDHLEDSKEDDGLEHNVKQKTVDRNVVSNKPKDVDESEVGEYDEFYVHHTEKPKKEESTPDEDLDALFENLSGDSEEESVPRRKPVKNVGRDFNNGGRAIYEPDDDEDSNDSDDSDHSSSRSSGGSSISTPSRSIKINRPLNIRRSSDDNDSSGDNGNTSRTGGSSASGVSNNNGGNGSGEGARRIKLNIRRPPQ